MLTLRKENIYKKNNRWYSLYECDCGNGHITDKSRVRSGHSTSCGCKKKTYKEQFKRYNDSRKLSHEQKIEYCHKKVYKAYKQKCNNKNIQFELTFEEFVSYLHQPCFYCGNIDYNNYNGMRYNGIDRLDSKLGYNKDNIVSCCGICNYMKIDYSAKEFIEQCKKIVQYKIGENK